MKRQLVLPSYMAQSGPFALSIHELGDASLLTARALLLTELVGEELLIKRISIVPTGDVPLDRHNESFPRILKSQAGWLRDQFVASSEEISPELIYEIFSRGVARNILSGHVLSWRFIPLLPQGSNISSSKARKVSSRQFPKFDMKHSGTTLTAFTTQNYFLLTNFLESAPLQALAFIEGVSTVTIRNRVQVARQLNLLSMPGSGRRGVRSAIV